MVGTARVDSLSIVSHSRCRVASCALRVSPRRRTPLANMTSEEQKAELLAGLAQLVPRVSIDRP